MIEDELRHVVAMADYVAARDVVQRLLENRSLIPTAKSVLGTLFREGDAPTRRYIVDGILEHLFEAPGVEELFADWRGARELSVAFFEAQAWAEPVYQKQKFLSRVAHFCVEGLRQRGIHATVKPPEVGIDSIEIELNKGGEDEHLILDCDYDVVEKFMSDTSAQVEMGKYAADSGHWTSDEYAPWQQWVHLHG